MTKNQTVLFDKFGYNAAICGLEDWLKVLIKASSGFKRGVGGRGPSPIGLSYFYKSLFSTQRLVPTFHARPASTAARHGK